MLMVSVLTPWPPVGVKLAVAVLSGGDDVLILIGSRILREKLNIDVIQRLKEKALRLDEVKRIDQVAFRRGDTGEDISAKHVPMSLSMVQQIADRKDGVSEEDENLNEAFLTRRSAMVMVPKHENLMCIEAWTEALERATQEGMALKLLQELLQQMLGEMESVFRLGLTAKPPAFETPFWLQWKPASHTA